MIKQQPNYLFSLYKGNIALFLEARAKNPSAYDYLLPQVQQQINNFEKMNKKLVLEKKQALDATEENIALWQTWFAIKLSMQEAADKMATKDHLKEKQKKTDDAIRYGLNKAKVLDSIRSAKTTLNPSDPKEAINMLSNGYCSDLNLLVKYNVVSQDCIDRIHEKISNNDAIAKEELKFLQRGDITNGNKHRFDKTGCADETDKNRKDFVNYANNDQVPNEERNTILDKYTTFRKVVCQCTKNNPEGSTNSEEQRNIVNYAKKLVLNAELLDATAKRKNNQP